MEHEACRGYTVIREMYSAHILRYHTSVRLKGCGFRIYKTIHILEIMWNPKTFLFRSQDCVKSPFHAE